MKFLKYSFFLFFLSHHSLFPSTSLSTLSRFLFFSWTTYASSLPHTPTHILSSRHLLSFGSPQRLHPGPTLWLWPPPTLPCSPSAHTEEGNLCPSPQGRRMKPSEASFFFSSLLHLAALQSVKSRTTRDVEFWFAWSVWLVLSRNSFRSRLGIATKNTLIYLDIMIYLDT